jgi:hypothetical protein
MAKPQVMRLNEHAGRLIARSTREAQRLIAAARASARGSGAQAKLRAAVKLEQLTARCQRVTEQIDRRARGLKITDRLVSLADPDARPIRKGKLGKPTEFGYVAQICEVTANTPQGRSRFHPARRAHARQPGREPAAAPDRQRARTCRHPAQGDRLRWRLPGRPHERRVPRPRRGADPAIRSPRARITQDPQAQSPLPNRYRGPHQPPQAELRAAPITTEGRRRNANLDRVGNPRLRPRHARYPGRLKHSRQPANRAPMNEPDSAAPTRTRPFQSPAFIRGK